MNHWPQKASCPEEKVDTFAFSRCNRRYQNLCEIPGSEVSSFVLAHLNVKKTATVSSWIPLVMFVFVLQALKAPWQNVWVFADDIHQLTHDEHDFFAFGASGYIAQGNPKPWPEPAEWTSALVPKCHEGGNRIKHVHDAVCDMLWPRTWISINLSQQCYHFVPRVLKTGDWKCARHRGSCAAFGCLAAKPAICTLTCQDISISKVRKDWAVLQQFAAGLWMGGITCSSLLAKYLLSTSKAILSARQANYQICLIWKRQNTFKVPARLRIKRQVPSLRRNVLVRGIVSPLPWYVPLCPIDFVKTCFAAWTNCTVEVF